MHLQYEMKLQSSSTVQYCMLKMRMLLYTQYNFDIKEIKWVEWNVSFCNPDLTVLHIFFTYYIFTLVLSNFEKIKFISYTKHNLTSVSYKVMYDMKENSKESCAGICGYLRLRIFLKYDIEQIKLHLNLVFVIMRRRLMLIKKNAEIILWYTKENQPNSEVW